jgi:hypothetical protein
VIAYVDASVLLRVALGQPNALVEWPRIRQGIAGALVGIESLRTLDRLRRRRHRAAQPMPTELGTLDAIHLATALLRRETAGADLVMATHDAALGFAARAYGLPVVGVSVER